MRKLLGTRLHLRRVLARRDKQSPAKANDVTRYRVSTCWHPCARSCGVSLSLARPIARDTSMVAALSPWRVFAPAGARLARTLPLARDRDPSPRTRPRESSTNPLCRLDSGARLRSGTPPEDARVAALAARKTGLPERNTLREPRAA